MATNADENTYLCSGASSMSIPHKWGADDETTKCGSQGWIAPVISPRSGVDQDRPVGGDALPSVDAVGRFDVHRKTTSFLTCLRMNIASSRFVHVL